MCAISGILSTAPINSEALSLMLFSQKHRGPDGRGVWTSSCGRVGLAHQRLAIIDLSVNANQPFKLDSDNYVVVFNGEIYNYRELKSELTALGHSFKTKSDTEVLLKSYQQWGRHCLDKFNGMFAFAIWDETKRELFCARDRFGEKPFYYGVWKGGFAFASEVKALLTLKEIDDDLDQDVLVSFLSKGENSLDAFDRTLYKGIKQLLPAQALTLKFSRGELSLSQIWTYWQIDREARLPYGSQKMESVSEQFFELLKSSVALRLRSDVPVGSSLSGGLDSSSIVSLIRYLEPEKALNTFTGRFPGAPTDEGHYADIVQKAKKTIHHEVFPTPQKFITEASDFYWHAEFPVGELSQFAQWCVFEKASSAGVKVLLDGQGSDEQLGGYGGNIQKVYLNQLFHEKRYATWFYEYQCAAKANPKRFSLLRVLLNDTFLQHLRPALRQMTARSTWKLVDLTIDDFQKLPSSELSFSEMINSEKMNKLSGFLWELSFRTMLSSLLRYGDRLSMAFGIEVRLPFCDHRLSEFIFRLPPELLVGESVVKRVLREGMKNLLPHEIRIREKQGFIPPQEKWLTQDLLSWVKELDVQDKGPLNEVLDRKKIVRFFKGNPQKDPNLIWRLLNLRAWSHFCAQKAQNQLKQSAVAVERDIASKVLAV